jgi:hypothetical protein
MRLGSAARVGFALVLAVLLAAFLVGAASAGDGDHHTRADTEGAKQANTTPISTASTGALSTDADTCTGSLSDFPTHIGVLSGVHNGNVQISGACVVNAGPTEVKGNLTVLPGSTLIAAFGETNFQPGSPASSLTVDGSISVQSGGTALLGCFATSFACIDDPMEGPDHSPTLNSPVIVGGSLMSTDPLGVVMHDGTIAGNISESGGGGGFNCTPSGAFAAFGAPVYSDYEDSTVGGWVSISDLTSCWLGVARVHVHQNLTVKNNQLADPDAIEVISNTIDGDLACAGNSMAWDSADATNDLYPRVWLPNTVAGTRTGQCEKAPSLEKPGGVSPGTF